MKHCCRVHKRFIYSQSSDIFGFMLLTVAQWNLDCVHLRPLGLRNHLYLVISKNCLDGVFIPFDGDLLTYTLWLFNIAMENHHF